MNLFTGRVVENKYYSETGYIDVILPQTLEEMGGEKFFTEELTLREIKETKILPQYSEGFTSNGITVKCKILSPLSSGIGDGMFVLPQVNSTGLVAEIDASNADSWGSESRYIWLGGLYGGNMYGKEIILPKEEDSETLEREEDYQDYYKSNKNINQALREEEDIDTIKNSPYRNEGMFLIRLKTCKTTDAEEPDESEKNHVHHELTPCTNEFVMKSSKVGLRQQTFGENDFKIGLSDLTLQTDKVKLSRLYQSEGIDAKRTEQIVLMNDEKLNVQFLDNENMVDRSLVFDNNKIELIFDNKGENNKACLTFDKEGNVVVESTGNCKVNVKNEIDIKNSYGCNIKMGKKISIGNAFGDLYSLIISLYKKLLTLHVEGTEMRQSGHAWASEFVPMDMQTLKNFMTETETDIK